MEKFILNAMPLPVPKTAIKNSVGQTLTLKSFHGKVLLVNFWATWCEPCIREMPSLDRLQVALRDTNFVVVAINTDRGGAKLAQTFLAKLNVNHLALYLDEKMVLGRAMNVRGLPTSFIITADGTIRGRLTGPAEWDSPESIKLIRYFLKNI